MNTRRQTATVSGMMMIEALTYISVLFVLLGCAFAGFYRMSGDSARLRLSADDVGVALETGERWRAEVRSARVVEAGPGALLLAVPEGVVTYEFRDKAVYRQTGTNRAVRILSGVKASVMRLELRGGVRAWTWDLELTPRTQAARVQPRFTFLAAQPGQVPP